MREPRDFEHVLIYAEFNVPPGKTTWHLRVGPESERFPHGLCLAPGVVDDLDRAEEYAEDVDAYLKAWLGR